MVVEIILATLAIAVAGSAVAALRGRRARSAAAVAPSANRELADGAVLPGDVIQHLGADYLVEGVAAFSATDVGKPVLVVAWLTDGSRERQLLIDLEAPPRCALAERRDAGGLGFGEAPAALEEQGRELRLARRAALRFRCAGEVRDLPGEGVCELGIYNGPGQLKAAIALHRAGAILLAGAAVTEAALTLLPGGSAVREGEEP
jgi:hypothetical protein